MKIEREIQRISSGCTVAPTQGEPSKVPVLIVSEDDAVAEQLRRACLAKGIASQRATTLATARESAGSDGFPVVVTAAGFKDGSWKALVDFATYHDLSFVVIVAAASCGSQERVAALDYGVFDVLEIPNELPKLPESITHGVWAAYLKGFNNPGAFIAI